MPTEAEMMGLHEHHASIVRDLSRDLYESSRT